jgi:UPF0755 protein
MIGRVVRWLAVVGALAGVAGTGWFAWALLRPGPPTSVGFEITAGEPAVVALEELQARGLLPSVLAGRLYLRWFADGRNVHFGRYVVPGSARPVDALERILEGRVESISITVVEGLRAEEIRDVLADRGILSERGWTALVSDISPIRDLAPDAPSLEGFLHPDTYRFAEGVSAEVAVGHMVDRFRQVWSESVRRCEGPLWGSTLEIVTLASLVEAESAHADELPVIAGVFRNRLRRGMLLQCDPTVVYAMKRRGLWTGRLLRVHWQLDDVYNTYRYPGLPPGPINSPGRRAIEAALEPAETSFLYFVARPEGGHAFSRTLREHNQAVARLQRSRR